VITEVTARVRPAPERRRYEGWMAADFASGADVIRSLAQSGDLPDVVRGSDEAETRTSLAMSGTGGAKRALMRTYLGLRGRTHGCIIICGWEGDGDAVEIRGNRGYPEQEQAVHAYVNHALNESVAEREGRVVGGGMDYHEADIADTTPQEVVGQISTCSATVQIGG